MNGVLDKARDHINELAINTEKQMRSFQGSKIGVKQMSPRQKKAKWKELMAMDDSERIPIMKDMLAMSGHMGDQYDDCDMCGLIKEQVENGG